MIYFVGGVAIIAIFIIALQYVWPLLVFLAGSLAAFWALAKAIDYTSLRIENNRIRRREIAARADRQHQQIMHGDEIRGTYGDHLPPPGLR